jgi:hypothetical protein
MNSRPTQWTRYGIWLAGIVFAIAVATPVFAIAGFARGPRGPTWQEAVADGLPALLMGFASQLGLLLSPWARARSTALRAFATVLMLPAFVFSLLAYRDLPRTLGGLAMVVVHQPVITLYAAIVPVYLIVGWWLWHTREQSEVSAA